MKALETEFVYTITENDQDIPDNMQLDPNLATALAWDNYDVNMETTNEKDQHHLKRMLAHRKVTTSQTSQLVGKAPKTCNSYPDAIFK